MKPILFFWLFLLAAPALAQQPPDSTARWSCYATPAGGASLLADSLETLSPIQIENVLLHQQNERLLGRESRFWGFFILTLVAAFAQAAAR